MASIWQDIKERKILDKDGKVDPLGPFGKKKLTGQEIAIYHRDNRTDKKVKDAVEVALDLAGAYDIARKEIQKFYGSSVLRHKDVQKALKYANEEVTESYKDVIKMYPRDNDWKKLITKHRRNIDDFRNGKKDLDKKVEDDLISWALDAGEIRNKGEVEDFIDDILNEAKTFKQLYKGAPRKSQLLADVQDMNKRWKNTKSKEGPYGGINDVTIRFSAPPTGNVIEPPERFKSLYPDGQIETDPKLGVKHAKEMLGIAKRLCSREPYKSAFPTPSMIEDPIQIYIGHQYSSGYDKNPKFKVDITPILEEIAKISFKKMPMADARMKDLSGFYGSNVSESIQEKVEYVEYKFRNKNDAQKALDYFKKQNLIKLDINDDNLNGGEIAVDAGNKDMTKYHKEVVRKFKPKVQVQEGKVHDSIIRKDFPNVWAASAKDKNVLKNFHAVVDTRNHKKMKDAYKKDMKAFVDSLKEQNVMNTYRKMWEDGQKYAPETVSEGKEFKQSDIDKVAKLTDRNEHTKSLIHIAKVMGDKRSFKKLELIDKLHNEYGHLHSGLKSMRDEVYQDLKDGMKKYDNGQDMYGAT